MSRVTILALRACIAFFLLVALAAQVFVIPGFAREVVVASDPRLAPLELPYVVLGGLCVLCAELVLVALWALLGRVRHGSIFEGRSLRWVDAIIAAGIVATVIVTGVIVHSWFALPDGDGNLVITGAMASLALGGAAFVLLMLVMRGLLVSATTLRTEMAEVI